MNSIGDSAIRVPSAAFFRFGAVSAGAAVFGILLAQLVFTPGEAAPGIAGLIHAYADTTFQAQSLTILIQVIAMFVALLILAVKVFHRSPGAAILSAAFLVFWQVFEMYPRAVDYFTFSRSYAELYRVGGEGVDAVSIEAEFRRFLDWSAGLRSMRQIVWSASLLLLSIAVWPARGVGRWVAALLLLNGVRVATVFFLSMAGLSMPLGRWTFIIVNVSLFSVLAYWLWVTRRPACTNHN